MKKPLASLAGSPHHAFVSVPNDPKRAGVSPLDDAWDELGPVDPLGTPTVQPPPIAAAADGGADDIEIATEEEPLDIIALTRSANTAAALGRAPVAQPTAKMNAFDLAGALAKSTEGDDSGNAK